MPEKKQNFRKRLGTARDKQQQQQKKEREKITRYPNSHTVQNHVIGTELFGYAFTHKGKVENVNIVAEGIHLEGKDPNLEAILIHYKTRGNTEERHPTKLKSGMNLFGTIEVIQGDRIVIGTFSPAETKGMIDRVWVTFNYAVQGVQE